MLTKVFRSGNSLAVRIPRELAIVDPSQEVDIERVGDTLVVRPVNKKTLAGLGTALAGFPSDFMADGREIHDQRERDWNTIAR
ncbi:SpoVT/AbrB protein (fragment) [Candidatus Accumulibacter aalborgensis]|uniref:SpoVT/AbrB protein n=1 Tax=Candidatus Accumulibacter aalborgensis TaxID=1860102 RepID=A0A1A8XPS0_9PROT